MDSRCHRITAYWRTLRVTDMFGFECLKSSLCLPKSEEIDSGYLQKPTNQ